MKASENNEIDLLLRNLAKRRSPADSVPQDTGDHLDPDELSSFAEGVLPAATRALYTAHLADCNSCRKIVAQLMAASGAVPGAKSEIPKAGLWYYLSSIFTPRVLRFAIPALSLLIVALIGVRLMRQSPQGDFVAQVNQEPASAPVPETASTKDGRLSKNSSGMFTVAEPTPKQAVEDKKAKPAREVDQAKAVNEVAASSDKAKEGEKVGVPTGAADRAAETRAEAGGRAEANTPPPRPESGFARERQAVARQQPAQPKTADTLTKSEERKDRDSEDEAERRSVAKKAAPASVVASGRAAKASERAAKDKVDNQASAETRVVSGRRFRRDDNGWVDTAYDSSMSLTNVARGSEQYRALIGDEPGLRAIAEQLDGVVLVVWKGKGYRIR